MRYEHFCVMRDTATGTAIFLAERNGKFGYTFGSGESWPNDDDLPAVEFSRVLRDTVSSTAINLLRRKLS